VPSLNWKRPTKYAQVTEDESFSVCIIRTEDQPFYEAWRTRYHPDGPGLIQTGLPTAQVARDLCEQHLTITRARPRDRQEQP